ncbi:MAG: hypothetical protein JO021_11405, partial [Alphaproteobacteria bacterium]|nr:hypothetical protein [Alphaproteobacteria bacterium]
MPTVLSHPGRVIAALAALGALTLATPSHAQSTTQSQPQRQVAAKATPD